jgi:signal transduction histidine kinase
MGAAVPADRIRSRSAGVSHNVLGLMASAQLGGAAVLAVTARALVSLGVPQDSGDSFGWPSVAVPLSLFGLSAIGFLVTTLRVDNPIGWIFALAGLGGLVGEVAKQDANVGISDGLESLPAVGTMAWLVYTRTGPVGFPARPVGFVLVSNGNVPSSRWRTLVWIAATAVVMLILVDWFARVQLGSEVRSTPNPLGLGAFSRSAVEDIAGVAIGSLLACVFASVAAPLVRLARSRGALQRRGDWVTYAVSMVAVGTVAAVLWFPFPVVQPGIVGAMIIGIVVIAFVVAILRFRRHDINVVISKAVLLGLATAFITALYLSVVVGFGAAIGSQRKSNLALSIVGAIVAAGVFQPARERVERLANRLVYGKRAAPYEVLAQFSRDLATRYPSSDLLPRMAQLLADGTGAAGAEIWLRSASGMRRVAGWPEHAAHLGSLEMGIGTRTVPVQHQGDVLGMLAVHIRPGSPLSPPDGRLLTDLAGQAGLILRNAKLIEELRTSRERLVTARDAERRRLERDIRVRVQRRLRTVASALDSQTTPVQTAEERRVVAELQKECASAMSRLQDLARGVYPPLLADQGLVAALNAHTITVALAVDIVAGGLGRLAQDVEAAAYFCCLEALQNVLKYARARRVVLTLSQSVDRLQFGVDDDGVGFDVASTSRGSGLQNMADRAAALGGFVEVRSSPGSGTLVRGWLPASPIERAP